MSLLTTIRATFLRPHDPRKVTFTPDVRRATVQLIDTFGDGMLASDIATSLSCMEIEILADLFRAVGDHAIAAMWIEEHGADDDCGDRHCQCGAPDCGVELDDAA